MRRQHAIVGTLILAGSAAIAVSVLLPAPGVIPAQAQQVKPPARPATDPRYLFPAAPARAATAEPHRTGPHRAAREEHHLRQHALRSLGLLLLPMPRPYDGRHVGVELGGQPRRRPAAGGRPGPYRESQTPDLLLTRHSAPWGRTSMPSSPMRGSAAPSGTVASPTSRPRLSSR